MWAQGRWPAPDLSSPPVAPCAADLRVFVRQLAQRMVELGMAVGSPAARCAPRSSRSHAAAPNKPEGPLRCLGPCLEGLQSLQSLRALGHWPDKLLRSQSRQTQRMTHPLFAGQHQPQRRAHRVQGAEVLRLPRRHGADGGHEQVHGGSPVPAGGAARWVHADCRQLCVGQPRWDGAAWAPVQQLDSRLRMRLPAPLQARHPFTTTSRPWATSTWACPRSALRRTRQAWASGFRARPGAATSTWPTWP